MQKEMQEISSISAGTPENLNFELIDLPDISKPQHCSTATKPKKPVLDCYQPQKAASLPLIDHVPVIHAAWWYDLQEERRKNLGNVGRTEEYDRQRAGRRFLEEYDRRKEATAAEGLFHEEGQGRETEVQSVAGQGAERTQQEGRQAEVEVQTGQWEAEPGQRPNENRRMSGVTRDFPTEHKSVVGGYLLMKERDPGVVNRTYDFRNRADLQKPERFEAGNYPILVKDGKGEYIPWKSIDLEGFIAKLPDIHSGAARWIRVFNEHTVGQFLSLGDLKALWARIIGLSVMTKLMHGEGTAWMMQPGADATELEPYKPKLWTALRREYPVKIEPKSLKGEPLSPTENPLAYVSKHLKIWRQETEEDVDKSPLLTTLFRESVLEGMPQTVRNRLNDVVGLTSKPHREFCDYIEHAIDRYRKEEQKAREQEKDIQKKINQLQLAELTAKAGLIKKKQSPPMQANVTQPNDGNLPTTHYQGVEIATATPQSPPVINVFAQTTRQPTGPDLRRMPQGPRRGNWGGQARHYNREGPTRLCWGCRKPGHTRERCQLNPWPAPPTNEEREGAQEGPNPHLMGPVNLWGSIQDY